MKGDDFAYRMRQPPQVENEAAHGGVIHGKYPFFRLMERETLILDKSDHLFIISPVRGGEGNYPEIMEQAAGIGSIDIILR